jgi:putative ATP-dependent endonuclease of OLD family
LGENNITYFALKFLENKMLYDTSRTKLNILLIEEPEAHIHKHLQKSLFSGVKGLIGNQIIMSTHSVHISESSQISRVVVLIKGKTSIIACKPSRGMNELEQKRVERYLDTNRIPLLFSKNVIVVEGSAELLLIASMMKTKYGLDSE